MTVTNTFSVLNPNTTYTLRIHNGGLVDGEFEKVSSSTLILNGAQVVGPNEFNQNVILIEQPVMLTSTNTLSVEVRGKPGGGITVLVIGIDNDLPTITASVNPSPNLAGWHNQDVTVSFDCADATSGIATCPNPVTLTTEGANQVITGTAIDLAGNTVSTSVSVNIDKTPPVVSATPNPLPNAAGWHNADATVSFTAQDLLSGVSVVSPPELVSVEGVQLITGEATDLAGNTGGTSTIIQLDKTQPLVSLLSPLTGFSSEDPLINVSGTASDLQGLSNVTINGTPVDLLGGTFVTDLSFPEGNATVTATATDFAGNIGTATATGIINLPPLMALTAPLDQSTSNSLTTTVTGTIDDPNAVVAVNGIPVSVTANVFTITLPLQEGTNLFTAVATDAVGRVATGSRTVYRDNTPPEITIRAPETNFETIETLINVTGFVQDMGGITAGTQVTVMVNGQTATVGGTSYQAINIPLTVGTNNIVATATDALGNTSTRSIQVVRKVSQGPMIELISGNNQSAVVGTQLPLPLIVRVVDGFGQAIANQMVIFKVVESNGGINAQGLSDAVTTDVNGKVLAHWTLGTRAGAGRNRVEATAISVEGVVSFVATGLVGAGSKINMDAGNSQLGVAGQPLPHPLVAVVTDSGHNRLANIPVTFTVREGGGSFDGAASTTINTDTQGQAKAILTIGFQEGIENNVIDVDFTGNPGAAVTFVASGRVAGNPALTSISGVVLDNVNAPIEGVTLTIEGTTPILSAVSNAQGRFTIIGVPVQPLRLLAEGGTALRPGTWPQLEYDEEPKISGCTLSERFQTDH